MGSDQNQNCVERDLGPNCWQRVSANDISRQKVNKNQVRPSPNFPSKFLKKTEIQSLMIFVSPLDSEDFSLSYFLAKKAFDLFDLILCYFPVNNFWTGLPGLNQY